LIITAKGVTSYPQIYPCILRDISKQYPVELGYRAIQLLSPNYIAMVWNFKNYKNDKKLFWCFACFSALQKKQEIRTRC